ncbi:MAG: hypothetical protein NZM33_16250 [Bryobacteraceae bacterium]|nr:hypothetical protein [Bryobacteraceae bacterium]
MRVVWQVSLFASCCLTLTAGDSRRQPYSLAVSPHFELLAPCRKDDCTAIVRLLESALLLFEENFGSRGFVRKTVVFIPDSPKFFDQLDKMQHVEGFFTSLPSRDYIVLRSMKIWQRALLHEFAHLWMYPRASGWPSWFVEGMAVYYEQFRVEKGMVFAGLAQLGRLELLRRRRWLPTRTVLATAHPSEIKGVDNVNVFYSQAWAIVHMLRLSPEYSGKLASFEVALTAGVSSEEALREIYGISSEKLEEDVRRWVRRRSWPVERLSAGSRKEFRVSLSPAPTATVDLLTSTLVAIRKPEAEREGVYLQLASKYYEGCRTELALGDLAFNLRLVSHAARHYQKAVECGTPPEMLGRGIELASLNTGRTPTDGSIPVERDLSKSRLALEVTLARFFTNDFEGVVRNTEDLSGLSPDDVFRATRLRAIALARLKRFDEAFAVAAKLGGLASDEFERMSAALTVDDVKQAKDAADREQLPPEEAYLRRLQRLEGVLTRVDCVGNTARLWIETGQRQLLKFYVSDPADVVTGFGDAKPLELRCGPQRLPVLVGYEAEGQADSETAGRLRYLRLRDP